MPEYTDFITENTYPTLCIKGFGKIDSAEIEFAPFTLFVGDNNSGKSYLMNLIWALNDNFRIFSQKKSDDIQIFLTKCGINIDNILTSDNFRIELGNDIIKEMLVELNSILDDKKNKIIQYALNDDHTKIASLQLKVPQNLISSLKIVLAIEKRKFEENEAILSIRNSRENDTIQVSITYQDGVSSRFIKSQIYKALYSTLYSALYSTLTSSRGSTFLPASRTSFLLTYPLLAPYSWNYRFNRSSLFDQSDEEKELENIIFLRSVNSFVDDLMRLPIVKQRKVPLGRGVSSKQTDTFEEYSNFIEKYIIKGAIHVDKETKQLAYTPSNSELSLPLHVTSSVVTEITPLLLFSKYGILRNILFMEEPEISLHLELQQQLTRLFIKMVNQGKQVYITTHSDTIIQHINNMIKLFNNPPERQLELFEQFNYTEQDMIDPSKIRMYQFDIDQNTSKTTIFHLKKVTKYGIEVPTFGDFLDKISDEVDEFLEKL